MSGFNNTANVNDGTVTTLDGVGVTIVGSGDQINGGANSNDTVDGSSDVLVVNQGTTGFVNGTGDTLNENGSGDQFNVANNGTGTDTINLKGASGDYVGLLGGAGYTVVGSSGTVATWDNTTFSVTGNNDVVSTDVALDGASAAGSTVTLTGTGDALYNGAGDTSYVLNNGAGTDTVVEEGAGDISNDQNAGTGAVAVTLNATGAYVGLLGGSGYTVTGSNATIETWDNTGFSVFGNNDTIGTDAATDNGIVAGSNADVHGAANTISLGNGDSLGVGGSGNVVNLGALNNTVFLTGTGGNADTVNGSVDSGAGRASDGQQVGIFLDANTQANVHGTGDAITVQSGDSLGVGSGGGNVVSNVGANDTIFLTGTVGLADTVIGSNDSGTGTAANGQQAGIFLDSNTQANLSGSGDTVSLGTNSFLGLAGQDNTVSGSVDEINAGPASTGNVIGTNDTLNLFGNSEAFGVFNSAGGNNTVNENGAGDVVNAQNQAGGTSLVNFASTGDYAGLLGGNGYTVTGVGGTVATWQNTGFSVAGYNDSIYTAQGDTAAVVGGGNTIVAGASTAVIVGGTGSDADAIYSNVPSNSGPAASGVPAGIMVLDNGQATVVGDGNAIETGTCSNLGTIGDGNAVVAGANATVAINGNYNQYASLSGGSVTFAGMNNTAALNNTALYTADGNPITFTGVTSDLGNVQAAIDQSPEVANQIDDIYQDVLGRPVDPQGLVQAQAALIAGGSLDAVRQGLAVSSEAVNDLSATLSSIGADPATAAETTGFSTILASAYNTPIEVVSYEGQVIADTTATNILAELPALETIDNGRTLSLGLSDGTNLSFADTAHLTDFVYAVAVQQSQATSYVTDTFNSDINWLSQVDQPILNVADSFEDLAAYNTSRGNSDQAKLANTAAQLALNIAAEAPGSRGDLSAKISLPGHTTEVTVFGSATTTADATFHDIDPGITGILEAAGLAVLNLAAIVFPETGLPYAAAAADAAVAGQDFANGQVVDGILSLAAAAGGVEGALGNIQAAQIINTAAEGVGGVYGVVTSAESGNALGIVAGVLEAAAATSSGIAQINSQNPNIVNLATDIRNGLNIAAGVTTFAAAVTSGNLAEGLINSLSQILDTVAADYIAEQASITNAIYAAEITPVTTEQPQHIAFVSGFFDQTINALFGDGPITSYAQKYQADYPNADVHLFSFDQGTELTNFINANGGNVTVVAHSWGADTAAAVVAGGAHVNTLITLDPIGYVRPDYSQVAANATQWVDLNPTGAGITLPNAIGGIGSSYGTTPAQFATMFANVNADHASIASAYVINQLLGAHVAPGS